jgi:hypothetical protein
MDAPAEGENLKANLSVMNLVNAGISVKGISVSTIRSF